MVKQIVKDRPEKHHLIRTSHHQIDLYTSSLSIILLLRIVLNNSMHMITIILIWHNSQNTEKSIFTIFKKIQNDNHYHTPYYLLFTFMLYHISILIVLWFRSKSLNHLIIKSKIIVHKFDDYIICFLEYIIINRMFRSYIWIF
jgi:hypothetical protein